MGEFLNPLSGMAPDRTLTDRELARALRMALSAKQEAVHLHEAIADATDSPLAKAVQFHRLVRTGAPEKFKTPGPVLVMV